MPTNHGFSGIQLMVAIGIVENYPALMPVSIRFTGVTANAFTDCCRLSGANGLVTSQIKVGDQVIGFDGEPIARNHALHCRYADRGQYGDNGEHDHKFNKREAGDSRGVMSGESPVHSLV